MYIDRKGNKWYRGNLHAHTTRSDGKLSYEEYIQRYKAAGYDFAAATDHWVWSETVQEDDFLQIAGCEYNVGATVQEGIYHIVAIGCDSQPKLVRNQEGLTAQTVIDTIHACNGFAILAHPSWSLNRVDKVLELTDIDGTEIYNSASGLPHNARPYSGDFVDMMAAEGCYLPCMAADDSHWYDGEDCLSYIMVKAEELTQEAIMKALRQGDYLATQGPVMEVEIRDGKCVVECTEAEKVVFYSDAVWSAYRVTCGENLTYAECTLLPHETFVRVEVIDKEGRTAWSSPIALR